MRENTLRILCLETKTRVNVFLSSLKTKNHNHLPKSQMKQKSIAKIPLINRKAKRNQRIIEKSASNSLSLLRESIT